MSAGVAAILLVLVVLVAFAVASFFRHTLAALTVLVAIPAGLLLRVFMGTTHPALAIGLGAVVIGPDPHDRRHAQGAANRNGDRPAKREFDRGTPNIDRSLGSFPHRCLTEPACLCLPDVSSSGDRAGRANARCLAHHHPDPGARRRDLHQQVSLPAAARAAAVAAFPRQVLVRRETRRPGRRAGLGLRRTSFPSQMGRHERFS